MAMWRYSSYAWQLNARIVQAKADTMTDSEGRPNGYYERLKYFRTEEFDEIVTLISFHMSDD